MNDVDVNVGDVRKVGKDHYPGMAKLYRNAVEDLDAAKSFSIPVGATAEFDDLEDKLFDYINQNSDYLEGSANHLDICGETLVDMADNLEWIDKDNAYNIKNPTTGVNDEVFKY